MELVTCAIIDLCRVQRLASLFVGNFPLFSANRDSACDNVELFPRTGSLPWYIWVIMAAVAFAVVSLIVVVCVCRCRRRTKERDDLDDSEFRPRKHN